MLQRLGWEIAPGADVARLWQAATKMLEELLLAARAGAIRPVSTPPPSQAVEATAAPAARPAALPAPPSPVPDRGADDAPPPGWRVDSGRRILALRRALGLSQNEISAECGCSGGLVSLAERGMPGPSPTAVDRILLYLQRLDDACSTSTAWTTPASCPTNAVQAEPE